MTFLECIQMQENLSRRLESLVSPLAFSPSVVNSVLLANCNSIAQSLLSTHVETSNLSSMAGTLSMLQKRVVDLHSAINYPGVEMALKTFDLIPNSLLGTAMLTNDLPHQPLLDSLSGTLAQIEPYLPEDKKEECDNIIRPKLSKATHIRLTLSDTISILSLLVTIFFGIVASMPDDQTERIIAQNDIIVEQQAEIIRLKQEDEALLDALDSLSDSINLLTDEIELLRDELENTNDPPDGSGQAGTEDTQQQDGDTQD